MRVVPINYRNGLAYGLAGVPVRRYGMGDASLIRAGSYVNWQVQGVNFDQRMQAFASTLNQTGSFNDIIIRTLDTQSGASAILSSALGYFVNAGYGNVQLTAKVVIPGSADAITNLIDWAFGQAGFGDVRAWRSVNFTAGASTSNATITNNPQNVNDLTAAQTWERQKQDLIKYGVYAALAIGGIVLVKSVISQWQSHAHKILNAPHARPGGEQGTGERGSIPGRSGASARDARRRRTRGGL